jgi:transcription initiation factor TFIID subunit 2
MGAKLEAGKYRDRFAFESDFRLTVSNCKLYNAPNTYPWNEAAVLENFFDKR